MHIVYKYVNNFIIDRYFSEVIGPSQNWNKKLCVWCRMTTSLSFSSYNLMSCKYYFLCIFIFKYWLFSGFHLRFTVNWKPNCFIGYAYYFIKIMVVICLPVKSRHNSFVKGVSEHKSHDLPCSSEQSVDILWHARICCDKIKHDILFEKKKVKENMKTT